MVLNKAVSLVEMGPEDLRDLVQSLGQPSYRARQIASNIYHRLALSYDDMTDLPQMLRTRLSETCPLHSLDPVHLSESVDGTVKGLFSLLDGRTIESALMLYKRSSSEGLRGTVCVSSQVGCAVRCPFCATGKQGLERNLTAGEIIDQVLFFSRYLRDKHSDAAITNIVFMGMGEPLANYDQVLETARTMNSHDGLGLGARSITISTAGLVPGIRKLAGEGLQIGLAVSLHAGFNETRDRLVPLNRTYPVEEVIAACQDYFKITGRRVSFEYALFEGVNDSLSEARALGKLLKGMNCHVNLIPANETGNRRFRPPARPAVGAFFEELRAHHITTTVRQSKGRDIDAACGQLRSRLADEESSSRAATA